MEGPRDLDRSCRSAYLRPRQEALIAQEEEKDCSIIGRFTPAAAMGNCVSCGHCDQRRPFHAPQSARRKEIAGYFGK